MTSDSDRKFRLATRRDESGAPEALAVLALVVMAVIYFWI
jgi:hypothetical protein